MSGAERDGSFSDQSQRPRCCFKTNTHLLLESITDTSQYQILHKKEQKNTRQLELLYSTGFAENVCIRV